MSLNKISTQAAIASPATQPTPAEAAPQGPSRAPASPGLESLRSTSRALVQAGTGLARRTATLTATTVSSMLMSGAEAGFHPAIGAAAAEGARHPQQISGDGSDTAKTLGIVAAGVAGTAAVIYAGYKAYQHFSGNSSAQTAPQGPAAARAGNVDNV